jgi:hypothetical protein
MARPWAAAQFSTRMRPVRLDAAGSAATVVRYAFRSDLRELKRPHLADEVTTEEWRRASLTRRNPADWWMRRAATKMSLVRKIGWR